MSASDLDSMLLRTLDDGRLSRAERQALGQVFDELDASDFAKLRNRTFQIAREQLDHRPAEELLSWCERIVQLAQSREAAARGDSSSHEAWFSPEDACARRLQSFLDDARSALDICVFTITDDRISAALHAAHRRGIAIRVLTDDDKSQDLGSDIDGLATAGIAMRTDRSPVHMHHKYAIADRKRLLTGSYNWTRSAARDNQENFLITDAAELVRRYQTNFERLWARFG